MNNGPITDTKRRLMLELAQDRELFDLINNKDVDFDCCDDLIYNNIFPFLKVDFTETQVGNYIGIGLDFPLIRERDAYKNSQITLLIICSTNSLRLGNSSYSRADAMSERIIEMLQNTSMFGFPMSLYSDTEGIHSSRFYYRKLIFQSKATNLVGECG